MAEEEIKREETPKVEESKSTATTTESTVPTSNVFKMFGGGDPKATFSSFIPTSSKEEKVNVHVVMRPQLPDGQITNRINLNSY